MAARKKKTVTVEIDIDTLKKLVAAAEALSELASGVIHGTDDPAVRALGKGKKRR